VNRIAEAVARSGCFPHIRSPEQALTIMQLGHELGVGPAVAVSNVTIHKGRVAVSAQLQSALVQMSERYDYRIVRLDAEACELEFSRDGKPVGLSRYAIDDARRAGLLNKDVWRNYPDDLLFARALTRGVRRYCPELLAGCGYVPEELGIESPAPAVPASVPVPNEPAPAAANGKATAEQLRQMRDLRTALGIGADAWRAVLAKRGVSTARDLPHGQADELLKKLAYRATLKNMQADLERKVETAVEPSPEEGGGGPTPEAKSAAAD
jgi:hypothetical protein